jgi:nanoRNase/pAp phosphatase (c-di-AMP/oligoRNAs hydrolase)
MSDETTTKGERLHDVFRKEFQAIANKDALRVILFAHRQADPDALCAAAGLSSLLRSSFPEYSLDFTIVAPQGASSLGENVCSRLGVAFQESIEKDVFDKCDLIVALDTGEKHLLDPYSAWVTASGARKVLVDHHRTDNPSWSDFNEKIINSRATSTCEIVTEGFPETALDQKTAQILMVGLLFDSQHLGIATASTLESALRLVRAGADIDSAKRILRSKPDRSELLARIKSAQRLEYEEIAGYIILRTEVSSFHAAIARMLLEIGGDVGVAYGETDEEARLSVRSTQSFHKETGIDMSEEVSKIATSKKIQGGGHATAASLSGKLNAQGLADELIARLNARLPRT